MTHTLRPVLSEVTGSLAGVQTASAFRAKQQAAAWAIAAKPVRKPERNA